MPKELKRKVLSEEKKGSILDTGNVTLLSFLKFQRQAADIGDNVMSIVFAERNQHCLCSVDSSHMLNVNNAHYVD